MSSAYVYVRQQAEFTATHWSAVILAGAADAKVSGAAWEELYRTYWYPLYAFIRRTGRSTEAAADLTQEFFMELMSSGTLGRVDPDLGRFRSFLLGALKHFITDDYRQSQSQKRGGHFHFESLEELLLSEGESRFQHPMAINHPPDLIFDKEWAQALVERALERLRHEWSQGAEDAKKFEAFKPFLTKGKIAGHFLETALSLGMTEGSGRSLLHRLRVRFATLLRLEVALTVPDDSFVEEELRYLFQALAA